MIFDITNPDVREGGNVVGPKLLAELTVSDLGHTFGEVDVASFQPLTTGSTRNEWFLVFGSGPTGQVGRSLGVSTQTPTLYSVNLNDVADSNPARRTLSLDRIEASFSGNGFVSGVEVADWDNDFEADAMYFGVVGDNLPANLAPAFASGNRGALMQAQLQFSVTGDIIKTPKKLLNDVNDIFATVPRAQRDIFGNAWVYAGTGRYIANIDVVRTNEQNAFYGVKLDLGNPFALIQTNELFPAHEATLFFDDQTFDVETRYESVRIRRADDTTQRVTVDAASNSPEVDTFRDLQNVMFNDPDIRGWYRALKLAQRAPSPANYAGNSLAFSAFTPSAPDSCASEGQTDNDILDTLTGLPQPQLAFLSTVAGSSITENGETLNEGNATTSTRDGFASTPAFINDMLMSNLSTGETATSDATLLIDSVTRRGWREVSVEFIE